MCCGPEADVRYVGGGPTIRIIWPGICLVFPNVRDKLQLFGSPRVLHSTCFFSSFIFPVLHFLFLQSTFLCNQQAHLISFRLGKEIRCLKTTQFCWPKPEKPTRARMQLPRHNTKHVHEMLYSSLQPINSRPDEWNEG